MAKAKTTRRKPADAMDLHGRLLEGMQLDAEARRHALEGLEHAKAGRMRKANASHRKAEAALARLDELAEPTKGQMRHPLDRD